MITVHKTEIARQNTQSIFFEIFYIDFILGQVGDCKKAKLIKHNRQTHCLQLADCSKATLKTKNLNLINKYIFQTYF